MSWAEIKKAVNSDLSTPLDLAPIADINGDKYYPVFGEGPNLDDLDVAEAVEVNFGKPMPVLAQIYDSSNDFIPGRSSVKMHCHKNSIYFRHYTGTLMRYDEETFSLQAETSTDGTDYVFFAEGSSVYTFSKRRIIKFNKDSLEEEKRIDFDPLLSDEYFIKPHKNGIYFSSGRYIYLYSYDLEKIAEYYGPSTYNSKGGFAVGGNSLVFCAGTSDTNSISYVSMYALNPKNLDIIFAGRRYTFFSGSNTYYFPRIIASNDNVFLLSCVRKPDNNSTYYKEMLLLNYSFPVENGLISYPTRAVEPTNETLLTNLLTELYLIRVQEDNKAFATTFKPIAAGYELGNYWFGFLDKGSHSNIVYKGYVHSFNWGSAWSSYIVFLMGPSLKKHIKIELGDNRKTFVSNDIGIEGVRKTSSITNYGMYPFFCSNNFLYFKSIGLGTSPTRVGFFLRIPLRKLIGYKKVEK